MVSARTCLLMLLPAALYFLEEARGSLLVEERQLVCDRRLGPCRYREAYLCIIGAWLSEYVRPVPRLRTASVQFLTESLVALHWSRAKT
uniref:Secreted protein n=1 Tax=Rhipicephalus appendiculatus TaxID=34631 RepID=A0A131YEG5_RHIAP